MPKWNRKNLAGWIEQHLLSGVKHLEDAVLCSAYAGWDGDQKVLVVAVNKKGKRSDYTRNTGREETGFNAGIWEAIEKAKHPVRVVLCHEGNVYLHRAPDIRGTSPHIRIVDSQRRYDDKGVAWWPWDDFSNWTDGEPHYEEPVAEPKAPPDPPDILELLNGDEDDT